MICNSLKLSRQPHSRCGNRGDAKTICNSLKLPKMCKKIRILNFLLAMSTFITTGLKRITLSLPSSAPDSMLYSKGIIYTIYTSYGCNIHFRFFFDRPTGRWNFDFDQKKNLKFWIYFFRSTDRPYKKHLEKIREAKNQLCLA